MKYYATSWFVLILFFGTVSGVETNNDGDLQKLKEEIELLEVKARLKERIAQAVKETVEAKKKEAAVDKEVGRVAQNLVEDAKIYAHKAEKLRDETTVNLKQMKRNKKNTQALLKSNNQAFGFFIFKQLGLPLFELVKAQDHTACQLIAEGVYVPLSHLALSKSTLSQKTERKLERVLYNIPTANFFIAEGKQFDVFRSSFPEKNHLVYCVRSYFNNKNSSSKAFKDCSKKEKAERAGVAFSGSLLEYSANLASGFVYQDVKGDVLHYASKRTGYPLNKKTIGKIFCKDTIVQPFLDGAVDWIVDPAGQKIFSEGAKYVGINAVQSVKEQYNQPDKPLSNCLLIGSVGGIHLLDRYVPIEYEKYNIRKNFVKSARVYGVDTLVLNNGWQEAHPFKAQELICSLVAGTVSGALFDGLLDTQKGKEMRESVNAYIPDSVFGDSVKMFGSHVPHFLAMLAVYFLNK